MKPLKIMAGGVIALALGGTSAAWAVDHTYTNYNNVNLTLAAGDTLTVGSGSGNYLYVARGVGGGRTLDASLGTSVAINVGLLSVGEGSGDNNTGTLKLSVDNTITAATAFNIGYNGTNETGYLTTADNGTTVIRTPTMRLGTHGGLNATGGSKFTLGSGATLTIEGVSGGRTSLLIGNNSTTGTSWSRTGTMDLSAGTATLNLSSLVLGEQSNTTTTATTGRAGIGTLTFSTNANNHLDVSATGNAVVIGRSRGAQSGSSGTLTIGNLDATSSITSSDNSTAILIADKWTTGAVTGTLNLNGGTLTINTSGAAIAGGGGTSGLTLGDNSNVTLIAGASSANWIHSLTTATIGAGGVTIDTNTHDLIIDQDFVGTGGLIKAGEGILELTGDSIYDGPTLVEDGTLILTGSLGGAGLLTVGPNGTLGGTGSVDGGVYFDAEGSLLFNPATLNNTENALVLTYVFLGEYELSFGAGFGVGNLVGLDGTAAEGTYTLMTGGRVDWSNLGNQEDDPYDLGGGKIAYFREGSLELVVTAIPEPATLGLIGVAGIAMLLRKKRRG